MVTSGSNTGNPAGSPTVRDATGNHGKLKIPMPFEAAVKAATEVPAEAIPAPEKKRGRGSRGT